MGIAGKASRKGAALLAAGALAAGATATAAAAPSAFAAGKSGKGTLTLMSMTATPVTGADTTLGLKAYVAGVNAHGGIDGYQLKAEFCFVGPNLGDESPNLSETCAHKAVSDHVTAVVGTFNLYDNISIPILQKAGIPVIGNFPYGPTDFASSWSHPLLSSAAVLIAGSAEELVQAGGCKTLGYIGTQGTPTTPLAEAAVSAVAKSQKVKFVRPQEVPATEGDFSPAVTTLQSEGADCIVEDLHTSQLTQPFVNAVRQNPAIKHVSMVATGLPESVIKAMGSAANGIYAVQSANEQALVNNSKPGPINAVEKRMLSDFAKYEPAATGQSELPYPGWEGGYAFGQVLDKVVKSHRPVTPASIAEAVSTMTVTPGVFLPSNFAQPGPVAGEPQIHATAVNFLRVEGGSLTAVDLKNHNVGQILAKYPKG